MKKILLAVVFGVFATASMAQYDENALAVLDAMSAKYKKIPAYSANITSSLINETEGLNEKFSGKIAVKGEMYKLELEEQLVINNGTTVWTYLPDVNEVNIDNYNPEDDEMSPSKIYDAYKNGYKYVLLGEQNVNGVLCSEIDLIPNDRDAQFFKIKLFIAKSDNSLKSWTMFDKSGNKYKYSIKDFKQLNNAKDSDFTFNAADFPGVDIIDLR
ncbi:LolA family protein [Fulvivirga lutea]|uniref:Outer membrane lipoprotein carrier protein LolA n=1 Tax=Fulvivirga lutea TaxID=2810512 RepID=A0A975A0W9_9BACT|nr:outer membrane lipoprotein carrier protein LolA [Fulvivirga lutea]QSE97645.1 outer membrane lipoprotein carrier protein LolA [Fulvivirga lutea]